MHKSFGPILVVDDEEINCMLVKTNLCLEGFQVQTASSAEEAMRLPLDSYSLVILDVMMGEMDGYDFARFLRSSEATARIPIILCTAKDSEDSVLEGYDCGIDDYVRKPFSMKELILRVKSVLRRSYGSESSCINFDELRIDLEAKICHIGDREILLTKREYELLSLLMSNPGVYFSRDEILNRVWHDSGEVFDRTVDVNINRLRKKIGIFGKHIVTKSGEGYGFEEKS